MKTLIVQEEFIKDLFLSSDSKHENINDLCTFLTKEFSSYNLICDFKNAQEYQNAANENPLWELMLDKIDNVHYEENLNEVLMLDTFYESIGECNIFLTTCSSEECDSLSQQYGYLFFCLDNINSQWDTLRTCKNGFSMKVTNSDLIPDSHKLNKWENLRKFALPLTGIVIFDKYILKNKSTQKIEHNLCPLLKQLLLKRPSKKSVDLTIICDFEEKEDIKTKYSLLTELFKKNNISNINLNIVKYNKELKPPKAESIHSRFILTNYLHISSTDSFNFFQSNGKINNDADVIFKFILPHKNFCFYKKDLVEVKNYIAGLVNDPNCPIDKYKDLYYISKKNYLLN